MRTRWAEDVDPEAPLPEHPRPQLVRPAGPGGADPGWLCLNGRWEHAIRPRSARWVEDFDGPIVVPFPVESALSGVARRLGPGERLWYRRRLHVPDAWRRGAVLLHFGAVDHEAEVWWNGRRLGVHRGGFTPFSFEVSAHLGRGEGPEELVVAVHDATQRSEQQRGKQSLRPRLITYTAVSGIWQTVWLEAAPPTRWTGVEIVPDPDAESVRVVARTAGGPARVRARVPSAGGGTRVEAAGRAGEPLVLRVPGAGRWSPETPVLHDLALEVEGEDGSRDAADAYFALRRFDVAPDARGIPRLRLNGEPRFFWGLLDQGYWPDGLYTAPTDAALRFDVDETRRLGFDLVRKHVKVEPLRWYHHCDRAGLVVWQDMPNGGRSLTPLRLSGRARADWWRELAEMVDALASAPCIAAWVPFNEGWGQFRTRRASAWLARRDPSRVVNAACGWFDRGTGDVHSVHRYPGPAMPEPEARRAAVLGEFGGLGLAVEGHTWRGRMTWGYRRARDRAALQERYERLLAALPPLVARGLSAAVYTQTTDVEGEVNGLLTYDREVLKIDAETLQRMHARLREAAARALSDG